MTISTYAQLVTATQNWLMDRTDLAGYAPDFITLAEDVLNHGFGDDWNGLRVREMETIGTIVSTAGVAPLPTDYLEYIRVVASNNGLRYPLAAATPDALDSLYPSGVAGQPINFAIVGSNLYTYPKMTGNIEITYYARIPALTSVATTNWLLTKMPSIYLRATLMQAAEFIKDGAETEKQGLLTRSLMSALSNSNQMSKYARMGVTLTGNTP